jgi:hypothetical protein
LNEASPPPEEPDAGALAAFGVFDENWRLQYTMPPTDQNKGYLADLLARRKVYAVRRLVFGAKPKGGR